MTAAIARGERLKDRYLLERTLGRGGMAAVWLGHDEVLDRPVAVKVLADTLSSDPGFLARFRREALTVAGLSHPNLVEVYDFSDEGARPYLVMQLVPGETLAARLESGGKVECDQLARELLGALTHIHAVGVLHRDIKPGNIILEPDGTAKLIDFGIALPRDATALTSTGLVLGTERYAAPEVMEGQAATERSDLYSCGVVLRSCEGPSSPALEDLIAAMTSKAPRDRPLSAAHALRQLERPHAAVTEPPTEVLQTPVGRPVNRRDRRKAVAAGLGLLAAAAIVVLVASSGGNDSGGRDGQRAAQAGQDKGERASSQNAGSPEPEAAAEPAAAPTPDPARGSALNEEGFALIQAGEYDAAVPILEEAAASFPEDTEDLNYAYALYNLGNALRLSGRPDEAIPILEQRLQIPNQEAAVREELEAAQAEAG
ncbi:MAG TPA: serine/threonine-protein kinase [Solirubrobacterales bacterium]|nr:serine/threonine-protein kinase [Solirubrobacterales bacterium]